MKAILAAVAIALVSFSAGCTRANSAELTAGSPHFNATRPIPPASPAGVVVSGVTVTMISATLAEDCGGTGAPYQPPEPGPAPKSEKPAAGGAARSMAQRACQQTSMQLSIAGGSATTASALVVKKVEILDDTGKSVGEVTPRSPMIWSAKDSSYLSWDEKIPAGNNLSVSYALSAPDWSKMPGRWGHRYVVKATVSVSGSDQTVQREVTTETQTTTHLPPGAVT